MLSFPLLLRLALLQLVVTVSCWLLGESLGRNFNLHVEDRFNVHFAYSVLDNTTTSTIKSTTVVIDNSRVIHIRIISNMRVATLLISIIGSALAFAPHKAVVTTPRGWKSSSELSMSGKYYNGMRMT